MVNKTSSKELELEKSLSPKVNKMGGPRIEHPRGYTLLSSLWKATESRVWRKRSRDCLGIRKGNKRGGRLCFSDIMFARRYPTP